ncbi:MAG TPA: FG-GAP-like repeat-containing protein [bacterium]|nr:FG-GAP-like repeat-containing protein [bacterium]
MKRAFFYSLVLVFALRTFGQEIPLFQDATSESALPASTINAWGQAWGDYDNDGDLDVLIARYRLPGLGIKNFSFVYRNDQGAFTDVSSAFGISSDADPTWHSIWVDFDNDDDTDLYYSAAPRMHLLRNTNGVFIDVAQQTNLVGQLPFAGEFYSCAWGDYDLDGDLDAAVTALPHLTPRLYLFRNDGGHFVEVRSSVGLPADGYQHMFVLTWIDFDQDGDPDLWTAGDDQGRLFKNNGGAFTEATQQTGLAVGPTVTSYWFDYDNDGDLDLYTIGLESRNQANQLMENNHGVFEDVAPYVGADLSRIDMSGAFRALSVGDYDNDGDQDIFIDIAEPTHPSTLLLNIHQPDGTWAFGDVAEYAGLTQGTDSYSSAVTDYNADGWLDLFIVGVNDRHILYKNVSALANHWIGFKLKGTQSNRDGIGARLRIVANGTSQIRTTFAGDGRLVQQLPWVHFGIGAAVAVDSVIVEWPLGKRDVLTRVPPDHYYTMVEGTGITGLAENPWPYQPFSLSQNYPNPFNASTTIEFALPSPSRVSLKVYSLHGVLIDVLMNERLSAGPHQVIWNAADLTTGIYYYVLQADDRRQVRKTILIR